jgi:hypothetical protein
MAGDPERFFRRAVQCLVARQAEIKLNPLAGTRTIPALDIKADDMPMTQVVQRRRDLASNRRRFCKRRRQIAKLVSILDDDAGVIDMRLQKGEMNAGEPQHHYLSLGPRTRRRRPQLQREESRQDTQYPNSRRRLKFSGSPAARTLPAAAATS